MKIRNILSVLFVGLLFTSCNSEEEVQRGNEDGRDISFSMTLTLGGRSRNNVDRFVQPVRIFFR